MSVQALQVCIQFNSMLVNYTWSVFNMHIKGFISYIIQNKAMPCKNISKMNIWSQTNVRKYGQTYWENMKNIQYFLLLGPT